MKIVVDELPESPKKCLFSQRNVEVGYVCTLRLYNEVTGTKPFFVCKPVSGGVHCDRLVTFERMMEER